MLRILTFLIGVLTPYFLGSFPGACLTASMITAPKLLTTIAVLHVESRIRLDWIIIVSGVVTAEYLLRKQKRRYFWPLALLATGRILFLGIHSTLGVVFWTYVLLRHPMAVFYAFYLYHAGVNQWTIAGILGIAVLAIFTWRTVRNFLN